MKSLSIALNLLFLEASSQSKDTFYLLHMHFFITLSGIYILFPHVKTVTILYKNLWKLNSIRTKGKAHSK